MTPTRPPQPFWKRVRRFLSRPKGDIGLLGLAYLYLGLARLAINLLPFKGLVKRLGTPELETPAQIAPEQALQARRVAWAVNRASRYTPWKSNCFPQAIAAKILLRQRGIPSTLYLGAAFKARSELEAHAWLRCGPIYVTGGQGQRHFGVLGIYA